MPGWVLSMSMCDISVVCTVFFLFMCCSNQRHSLTSRRPLSNQQAECSSHVRNSIPAQSTSMANSPHGFSHQRDRQQRDRFTNESRGRDWNTPGRGPSKKSVSSGGQPYSLSGTQIASSSALAHVQDIERVSLSGSGMYVVFLFAMFSRYERSKWCFIEDVVFFIPTVVFTWHIF